MRPSARTAVRASRQLLSSVEPAKQTIKAATLAGNLAGHFLGAV